MTPRPKNEDWKDRIDHEIGQLNKACFIGNGSPSFSVGIAKLNDAQGALSKKVDSGQADINKRFDNQGKWVRGIAMLLIAELLAVAGGMILYNLNSRKGEMHIAKIETR